MGLGDISLYKYQVMKEGASAPAIALRMAVKLPTGDESRVFGSGRPDVGVGLALEKTLASRFIVYGKPAEPEFLMAALYGIENLDFIRGSAADVTISTLFTYRFAS